MSETLEYTVSGMSCAHCKKAVSEEVGGVPGPATHDLSAMRIDEPGCLPFDELKRSAMACGNFDRFVH